MSISRLMKRGLLAATIWAVAASTIPAPVHAEGACCGRIKNVAQSDKWLAVGQGWSYVKNKQTVWPGMSSTAYYKDTDAVYIPYGCRGAFTAPGKSLTWKSGGHWYEVRPLTWPYHNYGWSVQVVC